MDVYLFNKDFLVAELLVVGNLIFLLAGVKYRALKLLRPELGLKNLLQLKLRLRLQRH